MQRTHLEAYEESVSPTGCPDFKRASSKIMDFTQQLKQSFGIWWGRCGKKHNHNVVNQEVLGDLNWREV